MVTVVRLFNSHAAQYSALSVIFVSRVGCVGEAAYDGVFDVLGLQNWSVGSSCTISATISFASTRYRILSAEICCCNSYVTWEACGKTPFSGYSRVTARLRYCFSISVAGLCSYLRLYFERDMDLNLSTYRFIFIEMLPV